MLRIALPNKGSLAEPASQMLTEAGYRQRTDSRELVMLDADNDTEFFFLRPRDIAVYVGSGRLDVGITGEDLLLDSGAPAETVLQLGFGESTFRFAGLPDTAGSVHDLAGKRIATAYPGVVSSYLAAQGVSAELIRLDGAVETAVRLEVADAIADVVSTGTTLRNAGLEIFGEPLLTSQAVLVRRAGAEPTPKVEQLVRRLQGVIIARRYVLMDYDIPDELVEKAVAITPGIESPTVAPLHERGWSAVRSMVLRKQTNRIMDELWDVGARAIFVTDIHACRL
ncbi:ATP phosphoribosyltransferase [Jatrophihabitans cynanchi]|jgi:ATP phosphoribosyltransferase|uniref:ATP phosphoribosyltransferase n=1 Tax=Jatrophihabitans cynanchi TaxID=2944128 RepID=A0ABY7JWK8_9ACTN|nr:ATP phosphoribosyltransferase [Jatrophihabitans sp. SB3-54]WAX56950.1 ATP phosphoribosyltransferase [Jatrophihabitans sp. SB3-54]